MNATVEIKEALRAKLLADATLVGASMLNGSYVYQAGPDVDASMLTAWITFFLVSQVTDPETQMTEQIWQFDIWCRISDDGDQIADHVEWILTWTPTGGGGALPGLTSRRLAEPIYTEYVPGDTAPGDQTTSLHHKVRAFRVATYPA